MLIFASGVLASCANRRVETSASSRGEQIARIQNVVVIYAENRSFDNLYGHFPGARGLDQVVDRDGKITAAYVAQLDRDGKTTLSSLPPAWGGVTAKGVTPIVTEAQSAGLANAPFAIEAAFEARAGATLDISTTTRDLWHRFFEHQMQIAGGANSGFAAWSDAGGLTMGHFDTHSSALRALAARYVLADHFFQGAFGGSFLNHQYLVCACAPGYPNADKSVAAASITMLEKDASGNYLPFLTPAADSPRSALQGPPKFAVSGNITPLNYFGDGKFYAINTMQPAYQPSSVVPADASANALPYADPGKPTTLPPQTAATIGDRLEAKGVSWTWYAGAWRVALADGMQAPQVKRSVIYTPYQARGVPNFQTHHQPFNYYASFDPATHADARARHLKDYDDLVADVAAGRLPAVSFYKPQGNLNQHPGYANIEDADQHIADLVAKLQGSPQWKDMLIVITYDEFGGIWDHVPPPPGDLLGPGTRIPAIVISPFAKNGVVDHTPYDTGSILRLITRRWNLEPLPGVVARDSALKANGMAAMGDLTEALK
ncbi:MAG: acid phosphatase [Burkholderiaceae bacterium]